MEKDVSNCYLVGYDPGLTIGVAYLKKGGNWIGVFETKDFHEALLIDAQWYGVEDYIPYRSNKFKIDKNGVATIKQIGVIEHVHTGVKSFGRSRICATISGDSAAPKKAVRQDVIELLKVLDISSTKMTSHEVDAVACILTLGTTLELSGLITDDIGPCRKVFQFLARKQKS